MDLAYEILKLLLTAGFAAGGSILVWKYQFTKQFTIQKRVEFLEKELSEFYGPIKFLHREIRALSDKRFREMEVFHKHASPLNPTDDGKLQALIEKHNKELEEIIIPKYRKIRDLFEAKGFLADARIIGGYENFCTYLRSWEEHLEKPIGSRFPSGAAAQLAMEHPEPLFFFDLIEEQFEKKKIEYETLFKAKT